MVRIGANPEIVPKFRLISVTRDYEVVIASNRESASCGESGLRSCTDRPSRHGSWLQFMLLNLN